MGEEAWLDREGFRFRHRVIWHSDPQFAPTVFVGGAFMTMDSWVRFSKAFARHTTVILVDPPGIGTSDFLPAEHPPEFLSRCLADVIEALRLPKVNLVAFSYGTPAGCGLAQLRPDLVHRMVLGGTAKAFSDRVVEGATVWDQVHSTIEIALRGDRDYLAQEIIRGLLNRRDPLADVERQALAARVLRSNIMQMSDEDVRRYAANTDRLLTHGCVDVSQRVQGPEVLVFTGEHDDFTRPVDCREVAAVFDGARFTTVRRADHIFNIEQFEVVLELLLWFMQGAVGAIPAGCHSLDFVTGPATAEAAL